MGIMPVGDQLLCDEFCAAIRISWRKRVILIIWKVLSFAINSRRGREDNLLAARAIHGLQEAQRANDIVVVILERDFCRPRCNASLQTATRAAP